MKNLNSFIIEKLIINKNSKVKKSNNFVINLFDQQIEFPIKFEIDHKYTEIAEFFSTFINRNKEKSYLFYNENEKLIVSFNEDEMKKIFVDEKGIMSETQYGYLPIQYIK